MTKDQGLLLGVAVIGAWVAYSFYKNKQEEKNSSFRGSRRRFGSVSTPTGGGVQSTDHCASICTSCDGQVVNGFCNGNLTRVCCKRGQKANSYNF